MSASTRPPLLQLGGEEAFAAYEKEFGRLYQIRRVTDVLGNVVLFRGHTCRHVCFKSDRPDYYKQGRRVVWMQERAEHIPWILAALTDPGVEVRPNDQDPDNRVNYLLDVDADPAQGLKREFFCVVAEWINDTTLSFVTSFPIDRDYWLKCRKVPGRLYP